MKQIIGSIILFAASSIAWAGSPPSFEIRIAQPKVRLLSAEDLRIQCQPGAVPLEGCTEFLGEELHCDCRHDGKEWKIAARAQLMPYVYIRRPSVEPHERKHLGDLQMQLEGYLSDLAGRRFEDAEGCQDVAEFESAVFNLRMDLFRRSSNHRLH